MKTVLSAEFTAELIRELKAYLALCDEALALTVLEGQLLAQEAGYQSAEFQEKRKRLIPALQDISEKLRNSRMVWLQVSPEEREQCHEVKLLFQRIQCSLMRLLQLDRENQQAMLRRGLVPVRHIPPPAAQKPHYVANIYQRNSA